MRRSILSALAFATLAAPAVAADGPWTSDFTRTYAQIADAFAELHADNPSLIAKTTLLTTPGGRDLAVYTFGNAASRDRVLLLCNHHGDEQWVAQLCLDFSRWLPWAYARDPEIKRFLDVAAIDVVPLGNPDGFATGSRYNKAGNDINRNFPYMWGHTEPGTSNRRPGAYAASEPETRALMDYQRAFTGRWIATLNYHLRYEGSDGDNFILLPWAYTRGRTLTATEMERYAPFLPTPRDAPTFTVDTVPNVFYPCPGTHTDWTWNELGSPALTMELGHGYRLPNRSQYVTQLLEQENLPVFRFFLRGALQVIEGT